jgi:antibiotic biosynthesis monooxygenase (ABM) superfamily enzyme
MSRTAAADTEPGADGNGDPDVTGAGPVTVSFTRRADPAQASEMTAWIRSGLTLAEAFPGFLGGGWVRTKGGSDEWHMLCRFDAHDHLAHWEASPERQWWLGSAQGMAQTTRTERRTGIEGWFDPADATTELDRPRAPAPPRWKQATAIWLGFFPLNLLATVTVAPLIAGWFVVLRVLLMTLLLTPVMTYLLLPWVTGRLEWWLQGRGWRNRHRKGPSLSG